MAAETSDVLKEMNRSKTVEGLLGAVKVARVADLMSIRLGVECGDGEWTSCTIRARDAVNAACFLLEAAAATDAIGSGRAADMLRLCGLNAKGWCDDSVVSG